MNRISKFFPYKITKKKPPIFIGGEGRSGTTLMRAMLNNHPKIFCGPETHFFTDKDFISFYNSLQTKYTGRISEYNENVHDEVNEMYSGIINNFFTKHANKYNKERWADKTPYNVKSIDFLLDVFDGDIKFIHMIRDGRDVAASIISMPWGPKTIEEAAHSWSSIIKNTRKHVGKDYYLEIKYEDLVLKQDVILREICDFIDERFVASMLEFYNSENLGGTKESSFSQIKQPLYDKAIARWEKDLTSSQVKKFLAIAGEELDLLGYYVK
ncbi:sulfotransferase [Candidatus Dojkabacteria bacterium]|jgi:hypothetical protein|uniref:Sulfotransferase n=1 Tax=Candidatus Dojkabacteria bacterium TaxID=2099670 RepID=A0A955IE12_9BACT|nr:sulfotransferase [Candidatus Dojkabacteria bacterium]